MRHAQRGQAILETVLFLPLFLIALFGMFVVVQQSALLERVQVAVRYGANITMTQNPYVTQSLFAMYADLDGQDPAPEIPGFVNQCTGAGAIAPQSSLLTDSSRKTFWQPQLGSVVPICVSNLYLHQSGGSAPASGSFYVPFTVNEHSMQLTAGVNIPSYLQNNVLGNQSVLAYAWLDGWTAATVGESMTCGFIGSAVKDSLEAGGAGTGVQFGQFDGTGTAAGWTGSIASPLPSAAPFLGSYDYFACGYTFGPQAVHTPAPS